METSELYKVSAQEARVQLSDLINKAIYGRQPSMITRQGKPAAVLISYQQWQDFQQAQPTEPMTSGEVASLEATGNKSEQPLNTDPINE